MWFENLPAVELARRLREIPLFRFVSVDELFRIAAIGRQVRHDAGRTLFEEGSPAEEAILLLEGKVALERLGGEPQELAPPALVGFQEVLEGTGHRETARSLTGSLTLSLAATDLRALLADNIELAQGLFRMLLAEHQAGNGAPLVVKGKAAAQAFSSDLKLIDRALVLREIPLFRRATANELQKIASIARQVPLVADAILFEESAPPHLTVVVAGELKLEGGDGSAPEVAAAGDAVGVVQVMAGIPPGKRARVIRPGTALSIQGEDLQNLMADDVELLQAVFSAAFGRESP